MSALGRRALLAGTGGLVVAVASRGYAEGGSAEAKLPGSLAVEPHLDAWIRIGADGSVTAFTGKAELGQGLRTALIQVVAGQLRLPPERIELVTADTARTANEGFTAGSHSMPDSGTALLHAAAQARALLVRNAATTLGVEAATLRLAHGQISAPDGRALGYGDAAAGLDLHVVAAAESPLLGAGDDDPIGAPLPRANIPPMVTGGPAYIQDLRPKVAGRFRHARVLRQPRPGARLVSVPAVEGADVVRRGSFVAVVADREWEAIKAHRALVAGSRWEGGDAFADTAAAPARIRALPARDMPIHDASGPAGAAVRRLQARYTRPYTMHGSIGPSCALAQFADGQLTVWSHTQGVFPLRGAVADLLRLPADSVRVIHVPGSGCYGHNGADDVAADAALIAQARPGEVIRVQWMREDEHGHEPYGPAMLAEAEAALDAEGRIVDWRYGVWSNTHNRRPTTGGLLLQNAALEAALPVPPPAPIPMPEGGGDRNAIPIYRLPNARVVSHFVPDMPLRVSALRSLGAALNVFAIESFMDELAAAAGKDPVQFRLDHLDDPRARDVVALAAEKFGWASRRKGSGFAFARYKNLAAYCAVALELELERETGRVRIGRVVAAVDSGQPINPDGIRNQIEGAIVQSASWTLYERVRATEARIESRDWSQYPILRFPAAPRSVAVHIIPRPGAPFLGTGEAGQGPTAAAIANAIADATGVRHRDMPLDPRALAESA